VTEIAGSAFAPSLESLHDSLKAELAKQAAADLMNDAVNKFDQESLGRKSLEDAAKNAGLDVTQVTRVNAQRRG